jgi:hypothetical protein
VSNAIWAISAASHGKVLSGRAIQSASNVSSYVYSLDKYLQYKGSEKNMCQILDHGTLGWWQVKEQQN